ncbi:MAG: DUF420 domain-containing protein [Planctomycetaceae bacterium]|nr:DUF420 domain-containing protein [Planctomycetaceae bacterium]
MIQHGFLGNDASFMLDFVVVALVLVVPVLLYSLYVVKFQHKYGLHRFLQIALGITLLVAVGLFEIDMRLHGGWENIVNKDPAAPRLGEAQLAAVRQVLGIHLIFAISTPFLWGTTLFLALKRFAKPPVPGTHSKLHKTLGWLSVVDLVATSVTGLWFYYVAFVV